MLVAIVCSNAERRTELVKLIAAFRGNLPISVREFASPADAVKGLKLPPTPVDLLNISKLHSTRADEEGGLETSLIPDDAVNDLDSTPDSANGLEPSPTFAETVDDVKSTVTLLDAANGLTPSPPEANAVFYSIVDLADAVAGLHKLQELPGDPRIIVEFPENGDDASAAVGLLSQGAFQVVCNYLTRRAELWKVIRRAVYNDQSHEKILNVTRPVEGVLEKWGFMSMTFDPGDQNDADFDCAIKPVMELLRLELHRLDEIDATPPDLRVAVHEAIVEREVTVAQVSSTTANTMYEVGFAYALGKAIIFLWRRGSTAVPALLAGSRLVEYATMTELAMKLFFGLGGTRADLERRGCEALDGR